MRVRERLYLTEDRSKAVRSDDRRGRHLLCKKGSELDDETAHKYGIIDGYLIPDRFWMFTEAQLRHLAAKYGIETLVGVSENELVELLAKADVSTGIVAEAKAEATTKAKKEKAKYKKVIARLEDENSRLLDEVKELRGEVDKLRAEAHDYHTEQSEQPDVDEHEADVTLSIEEKEPKTEQIIPPETRRSGKRFGRGKG